MIKNIQYLKFNIGGYHGGAEEIKIKKNLAKFWKSDYNFNLSEKVNELNILDKDKEELVQSLNSLNLIKWKDNYTNNNIFDGTQWKLKLKYNEGSTKKIYGSNEYPGNPPNTMEYSPDFIKLLDAFNKVLKVTHFDT